MDSSVSSETSLNQSRKSFSNVNINDGIDQSDFISERITSNKKKILTPPPPKPGPSSAVVKPPGAVDQDQIRRDEMIRDAERLKATIVRPPGMAFQSNVTHSGCDDSFFQSVCHVDKQTREKIKRGESVDLVKLLPRNKYLSEDQHKMGIFSKDGATFFVPITSTDEEVLSINNFKKWEPHRAWELLEYMNSIETAAETFSWKSIYCYERIFRDLMEEFSCRNSNQDKKPQ